MNITSHAIMTREIPVHNDLVLQLADVRLRYQKLVQNYDSATTNIHEFSDHALRLAAEGIDIRSRMQGNERNFSEALDHLLISDDARITFYTGFNPPDSTRIDSPPSVQDLIQEVQQTTGKNLVHASLAEVALGTVNPPYRRKSPYLTRRKRWEILSEELEDLQVPAEVKAIPQLLAVAGVAYSRIRFIIDSLLDENTNFRFIVQPGKEEDFWRRYLIGTSNLPFNEGIQFCRGYIVRITEELKSFASAIYGEDEADTALQIWGTLAYMKFPKEQPRKIFKRRKEIIRFLKEGDVDEAYIIVRQFIYEHPDYFNARQLAVLDITPTVIQQKRDERVRDIQLQTAQMLQRQEEKRLEKTGPVALWHAQQLKGKSFFITEMIPITKTFSITRTRIYFIESATRRKRRVSTISDEGSISSVFKEFPEIQVRMFEVDGKSASWSRTTSLYPGTLIDITNGNTPDISSQKLTDLGDLSGTIAFSFIRMPSMQPPPG